MLQPKNPDLIRHASRAFDLFPDDKEIFSLMKLAVVGQENLNEAAAISQSAQQLFSKALYVEAALEFEKAAKLDQLEYAHFENIASAYFMAGDYEKALIYSDKVINEFNPKTGKSEYIKALALLNIGETAKGCELLLKSINFGYDQAKATYDQQCN